LPATENSDLAAKKEPRQRGKGFPTVALPDAVRIVREAGKYGTTHALSAFAGYMGHRTTNSGPFKRRFAALRDWGLVTKEGQTVKLTPLGSQLALPTDPSLEPKYLREAFENCVEFQEVYDRSAKGVELDLESVANIAVHELGVSAKTKKAFAGSFAKSAVAVGLAEQPSDEKIVLLAEEMVDDLSATTREEATEERPPVGSSAGQHAPVVFRQPWAFPGGQVTLEVRLNRALPPESFTELGAVAKAVESFLRAVTPEAANGATE
jgi:hypothetical protein